MSTFKLGGVIFLDTLDLRKKTKTTKKTAKKLIQTKMNEAPLQMKK